MKSIAWSLKRRGGRGKGLEDGEDRMGIMGVRTGMEWAEDSDDGEVGLARIPHAV
jgi:hypothetical protein